MSVRVRYKITTFVSSTTAEDKDLANQNWEIVTDTQGEGGSWKSTIQPTDTDIQIRLGNLAIARVLLVRTTAKDPTQTPSAIVLKRNSTGGEAITVLPLGDAKEGHFVLSTDSLTALYVSGDAGGVPMEITVIAAGD